MTVGELRKLIGTLPDDMLVVRPISDHAFERGYVSVQRAVREGKHMFEWYDGDTSEPFDVLCLGDIG